MRTNVNIYTMSDKELKSYRRAIRLRRERRCKILISCLTMLATLCIIIVSALSYHAIKTNANSGFKYYTSVVVDSGETLWDIADDYIDYEFYKNKNSYIAEVQSINHLDDDCTITAGQTLIVPYYSGDYVK